MSQRNAAMNRIPADDDDDGDDEVLPDASQSYSLPYDARQSFDPFNDVFSDPPVSYPQAQVFPRQSFHGSRPEDAWTENESGRDLFDYLQSDDPLWWDRNLMPDILAAEESDIPTIPRDVEARAIRSPLGQLQARAVVTTIPKTVDDKELPSSAFGEEVPGVRHTQGRSEGPSEAGKYDPAQPKLISRDHTAISEEQSGGFGSGANTVSQFARTGIGEDSSHPLPGRMQIGDRGAVDFSRVSPAPKRRGGSQGSDREERRKKLKRGAAAIPSISNEDTVRLQGQHLNSQALYRPREHSHHQGVMNGYFPLVLRGRPYSSDCENEEERRPESAYPDPSLYALASVQGKLEQPRAIFQPLQANNYSTINRADLPHQKVQSGNFADGSRRKRRPTARSQLQTNPGIEADGEKRKIEWPGQRPPDLTHLSAWPPPYPGMNQPGPGGPGTWPSDWIELECGRTQMKYPQFLRGTGRIPGRYPWQTYCYWFPNHVRDAALDHFRAAGWSGRKVWDHYHPNAVEVCRKEAERRCRLAERPWNFLQQWFSRRNTEVKKGAAGASNTQDAASQTGESTSDDSSSDDATRQAHRRPVRRQPVRLQPNLRPSTRSMAHENGASRQTSQLQSKGGLGLEAGYFSSSFGLEPAPAVTQDNRPASSASGHSQTTATAPWWQGQLMIQIDRVRQLLQVTNPASTQQSNRTQIVEADSHLRRQFPMFARSVWLQVLQGRVVPQDNLHPMNALRDIYSQLRQADPHLPLPDEQNFCDGMMERYLQYVNNSLDYEVQKLHEQAEYVNVEAFQHPQGSLYDFYPANSTSTPSSDWLLQQPISYHGVGQSQYDSSGTLIEGGRSHASSIPRVDDSQALEFNIPPFTVNQPELSVRASPQPVSSTSLVDIRAESRRQRAGLKQRSPSKEPYPQFERPPSS